MKGKKQLTATICAGWGEEALSFWGRPINIKEFLDRRDPW